MTTNPLPLDEWERDARANETSISVGTPEGYLAERFASRILALIAAVRERDERAEAAEKAYKHNLEVLRQQTENMGELVKRAEAAERQRDRFAAAHAWMAGMINVQGARVEAKIPSSTLADWRDDAVRHYRAQQKGPAEE